MDINYYCEFVMALALVLAMVWNEDFTLIA